MVPLATGVRLDTVVAGPADAPPIIFLHGFPESNRTWRHQIADLDRDHRVIAPSQRGYGLSDKPSGTGAYRIQKLTADVFALADALGIDRFTLAAHDWGGAVGWAAALDRPERISRLVIANAPHPLVFQRSLVDSDAQRRASSYIRLFRVPGVELAARIYGLERLYDRLFGRQFRRGLIDPGERQRTLADWRRPGALTAMLNWYRAAPFAVPRPGRPARRPEWTLAPFPRITVPTLVVWGTRDDALLPLQLDGLDTLVDDLSVERIDAGHFVPWEAPDAVTAAIRSFLAARPTTP